MFTIEVAAIALLAPLDYLVVSTATGMSATASAFAEDMARNFATAFVGLIWVVYVWRSVRVKNTFVY